MGYLYVLVTALAILQTTRLINDYTYSLCQKKRTLNSDFLVAPLEEGVQKFTWSII